MSTFSKTAAMLVAHDLIAEVRGMESRRVAATATNNVADLAPLLDDDLIYISSVGAIFDKASYLNAIATHALTYDADFRIGETEQRAFGDTVILVGMMTGHARMDGDQTVFHRRSMSVWRRRLSGWGLAAWQSSACLPRPF